MPCPLPLLFRGNSTLVPDPTLSASYFDTKFSSTSTTNFKWKTAVKTSFFPQKKWQKLYFWHIELNLELGNIYLTLLQTSREHFLLLSAPMINSAQWNHIKMLTIFFMFNVLLLTFDIYTDFATAYDFFSQGHFYWGLLTLLPIFSSMTVRIFIAFSNLLILRLRKDISRYNVQLQDLPSLIWHFPLLHPVK